MKMKYTFACALFVSFLLFLSELAMALRIEHYRRKNEIGFGFNGNVSTLFFNTEHHKVDAQPTVGGGLSFIYSYSFNPHWSIGIDASAAYYTIQVKSGLIEQTRWETYEFDTIATIGLNSRLENWTERQQFIDLSIALKFRYNTPWYGNIQYYVEIGEKTGTTIWNSYNASASRLITTGDYPEFLQHLINIPNHGFGNKPDVSYKGKTALSGYSFLATLEMGIKHSIGSKSYLYTGLFAECGVINTITSSKEPLFSYYPEDLGRFEYSGILQTDVIKDGRMIMLSGGIRIYFTFGL
jgi:hypothetical protein